MSERVRVLIVEDHPVVRMGLRALIESQPGLALAGEARDGEEAVRRALDLTPDVVLMDLLMPIKDGLAATIAIRQAQPDARILILTSFADSDKLLSALRAGALGYILKDAHPGEIVEALRHVSAGRVYIDPSIVRYLAPADGSTAEPAASTDTLTEREVQVLRLVAQGLSNDEIAARLMISKHTVGVHVGHILQKLSLSNRTQATLYALRVGLAGQEPT